MIRRPPRSTLFPYTNALPISPPASRSTGSAAWVHQSRPRTLTSTIRRQSSGSAPSTGPSSMTPALLTRMCRPRSEEHTSELQSRQYLVCRLLLEKKTSTQLFTYFRAYSPTHHLPPSSQCSCHPRSSCPPLSLCSDRIPCPFLTITYSHTSTRPSH